MSDRNDIFRLIESRRDDIKAFGVKTIGVFGSFARNEQRPESDAEERSPNRNSLQASRGSLYLEQPAQTVVTSPVKGDSKHLLRAYKQNDSAIGRHPVTRAQLGRDLDISKRIETGQFDCGCGEACLNTLSCSKRRKMGRTGRATFRVLLKHIRH